MNDRRSADSSPWLLASIDVRPAGERCLMRLGDLDGDGRMELLLAQPDGGIDDRYVPHQVCCLSAFDLDGRMLWQVGSPDPNAGGPGADYPVQIWDIDEDGENEVVCVMNGKFCILDGRTGLVRRTFDLPDPQAHDCIVIANLTGGSKARDVLLKDRYRRIWALDGDFRLLWTYEGNPGHFPWVYDFDGDGCDEVMAGYDYLDHDGKKLWSCRDLKEHADCVWVGDVDGDQEPEIVIGGSVTVMYDRYGNERWRYTGSIESQHVALGRFRADEGGRLQVAGLDRIVRGDVTGGKGKDGMFLLDASGREIWRENRTTDGWLTIIETVRHWDDGPLDYILAYRRGGGEQAALYDGEGRPVVRFPRDGYAAHADLTGTGYEQVVVYGDGRADIFGSRPVGLSARAGRGPLPQPKRLGNATLYPGGER